jgi:hypothetical protein
MQSGRHLHFWRILILVMFFVATEDRFWNAVTQHQSIWSVLEAQKEDAIREQEANPGHVWGITEEDEESKSVVYNIQKFETFKNSDGKTITFMTPAGEPITLPFNEIENLHFADDALYMGNAGTEQAFSIPVGALLAFKLKQATQWDSWVSYGTDIFRGYSQTQNGEKYKDQLSKTIEANSRKVVITYPCFDFKEKSTDPNAAFSYSADVNQIRLKAFSVPFTSGTGWPANDYVPSSNTSTTSNNANPITVLGKTMGTTISNTDYENWSKGGIIVATTDGTEGSINYNWQTAMFLEGNSSCSNDYGLSTTVIQIANFINQTPGLYSSYVSCKNDYLYNPYNTAITQEKMNKITGCTTCVKTNLSWDAYKQKIATYKEDIVKFKQTFDGVNNRIEKLSDNANKTDIEAIVKDGFCTKQTFGMLSMPARLKMLTVIANLNTITGCWSFNTPDWKCPEGMIIEILKTTPEQNYKDILTLMSMNGNKIFKRFLKDIDNQGVGGRCFDEFIKQMVTITAKVTESESVETLISSGNFIDWAEPINNSGLPPIDWKTRALSASIENNTNSNNFIVETYITGSYHNYYGTGQARKNFSPFENILFVTKNSEYKIGNTVILEPNSATKLPAFLLYALQLAQSGDETMQATMLTAKAVGLVVSIYASAGATSAIGVFVNALDAVSIAYDLVMNDAGLSMGLSEEDKKIVEVIDRYVQFYALCRMGYAASSGLLSSAKNFRNFYRAHEAKISALGRGLLNKCTKLDELTGKLLQAQTELLIKSNIAWMNELSMWAKGPYAKGIFTNAELNKALNILGNTDQNVLAAINAWGLDGVKLTKLYSGILKNESAFINASKSVQSFTKWFDELAEIDWARVSMKATKDGKVYKLVINKTNPYLVADASYDIVSLTSTGNGKIIGKVKNRETGVVHDAEFSLVVNNAEWQAIKTSIANRIAGKQGWALKYTDNEIQEVLTHGKGLNLPDHEIEDIILNGCRPDKSFSKADLISQCNFWNIVKQRGYPNLFQSLQEYEQFSGVVKQLAQEWDLPANAIYVQGSSLRISNAADIGDLDIAIKVDAATFDNLVERFKANTTNVNTKARIGNNGKIGGVDMFKSTDANGSFTGGFYPKFETSFGQSYQSKLGVPMIQISIVKQGSSIDVSPFLILK